MTEISEKEWPALKKALWRVLMDENLNDGHYIKAFDLVERLYKAAAHARAEAVGVKPLEWNEYEREGVVDEWDAFDGFSGYYNIVRGAFYFKLTLSDGKESSCEFQSLDEAKAAAQADYERRILSALAHPAVPEKG